MRRAVDIFPEADKNIVSRYPGLSKMYLFILLIYNTGGWAGLRSCVRACGRVGGWVNG